MAKHWSREGLGPRHKVFLVVGRSRCGEALVRERNHWGRADSEAPLGLPFHTKSIGEFIARMELGKHSQFCFSLDLVLGQWNEKE